MPYSTKDLEGAYRSLGIARDKTVFVTADLAYLGPSEEKSKEKLLESHFQAIMSTADTVVVPTHSFSLCNTKTPFDPEHTPSETGLLTEYIRRKPGSVRQFHPFSSRAAFGRKAERICSDCSRHANGPFTPFERMIEDDAVFLSVGMMPQRTSSIVHYMEFIMAVPYRYIKEFIHPVMRDGVLVDEPFYLHSLYREMDIVRNRNEKIFANFVKHRPLKAVPLGKSFLYCYSMRDFYEITGELMKEDIFSWLANVPEAKPYRK